MKELSRRILRCSFWCVIVSFFPLVVDAVQKQQGDSSTSQEAPKEVVSKSEFKAPRVDGDGNVYAAVPIADPVVASVQASVVLVQTEVGVVKTDVVKVNTRLTETDSKIDTGFFTLNSKLDSLLIDTDNLQVSLNTVSDDVVAVGSKLDVYNSTLNNKLDSLLIDTENLQIGLDFVSDNVLTVGSKLDVYNTTLNNKLDSFLIDTEHLQIGLNFVSDNVLTVDSKLDACCFTSNSKLDLLLDSSLIVESMLENLNVVIDVTTLESKLDACCLTMNNKLGAIFEDTQSILDNLNVVVDMATLESKLDACCFTTNGKLDLLVDSSLIVESMLENLNVVIDMTTLESKLDACCFTTNGKLDLLIDDVSVVESLIVEGGACEPTPLSVSDVVGGVIVLAVSGNYCLAQDLGLSGAITVSVVAHNITLCLNNRQLVGHVEVYGARAQIKNGTVTVPAGTLGIKIAATASLPSLSQLKVICASEGAGTALEVRANGCVVFDSLCAGGGTGGDGIALYGSEIFVHNVDATASTSDGGHCIACYAPASKNSLKLCRCDGCDGSQTPGVGCGVYIAAGCSSIEIRDGTLARTASFAIEDNHVLQSNVSSYSSVIYNNFAYDSAQSSATYQIRNKKSMGQSYGVDLISGSPGLYANVYIP